MANKFYTVEKEIYGKKYTFQFNGLSAALKAVDSSYLENSNQTSVEKLANYLFKHVVVEPANLEIDDFESMEEFNEVIAVAREVMSGNLKPFREEKDKGTVKKSSKG